jgi:hypothetical protein
MLIGVQLPKTEPARGVWQRMVRLSRFCVSICTFVRVICVSICTFVLRGVAEDGAAVALLRQYLYFVYSKKKIVLVKQTKKRHCTVCVTAGLLFLRVSICTFLLVMQVN